MQNEDAPPCAHRVYKSHTMSFKTLSEFQAMSVYEKTRWLKHEVVLSTLNDQHITEIIDYFFVFATNTPYDEICEHMTLSEWRFVDRYMTTKKIAKWNYLKNSFNYYFKKIEDEKKKHPPMQDTSMCIDHKMYTIFEDRGCVEGVKTTPVKRQCHYIASPLSDPFPEHFYIKRTRECINYRKYVLRKNHVAQQHVAK